MKALDFVAARERAISHLGKFYNLQHIVKPDGDTGFQLELEVLKNNSTLCLQLTIILESDFPLSLPSVILSSADVTKLGVLPNISSSGLICTFDANTNIPNPDAPEMVLEACVKRAKDIIEDGLKNNNLDKYNDEFIAYWENKFESEEAVDTTVLSLISENDALPTKVNYVEFEKPIGRFRKLIFSEEQQFDRFKAYFKKNNIAFRETSTFYLGEISVWPPPYHMSNKTALDLIKTTRLENSFSDYLRSRPVLPIVTFARVIDSKVLIFGWQHKPVQLITHRRRGKFVQSEKTLKPMHFDKLLDAKNSLVLTQRFSPQIFDRDRLIRRTAADYKQNGASENKKILIAGLGSIGSNLIPFLEKSGVAEYRLVDDDYLSLENIGRHFLGINDTGRKKTEALRDYLERKNPLTVVRTKEQKIVQLIQKEPTFLSDCDFYLFCTGDSNSESWVAQNVYGSEWNHPSLFIWVEPYLAGGHCVYVNGVDPIDWESLFPDNKFIYNIISDETHQRTNFLKREAGCQVTFLPYSSANLQLFIAAIFPKMLELLNKRAENKCFSWVGDLATLKEMKIGTSQYVDGIEPFSLVERQL